MQIQIHTDNHITCHEPRAEKIRETVASALSHLTDHLSRIDVYLSDENCGKKNGDDAMLCKMEAHVEGRPAIVVASHATNLDQAVDAAAEKLASLIEHTLGKIRDQRHHPKA